jgi:PAS domain S-box-containing protein
MTDRNELLEAAFDSLPEGVALVGTEGEVVLWNQAAQGITGYAAIDVLARPLPEGLEALLHEETRDADDGAAPKEGRRALVNARHKLGHGIPVIARVLVLRDGLAERIGMAALFHPAESLDALPHGESSENEGAIRAAPNSKNGCKWNSTTSRVADRHSVFCGSEWIRQSRCARRTARAPATRCWKRFATRWCMGCARLKR